MRDYEHYLIQSLLLVIIIGIVFLSYRMESSCPEDFCYDTEYVPEWSDNGCSDIECIDPEPLPPRNDWGGDYHWYGHCVNTILHGKLTNGNNTIHVWFNGCRA